MIHTNQADRIYRALAEGNFPFDNSHNIRTPRKLVEEILNNITIIGNVLVMFNVEFVVSLVYTYNVDPSTITFYSDHADKSKLCERMGVKYITQLGTTNMKFDVVIGNPPYNDTTSGSNLYFDFIKKSFTLCPTGTVAMIVPASWMTHTRVSQEVVAAGLQTVTSVDTKHFPTVVVRSGITAFVTVRGYNKSITIKNGDLVYSINRTARLSFSDPFQFAIVDKVKLSNTIADKLNYGPYAIPAGTRGSIDRLVNAESSFSIIKTDQHTTNVLVYTGSKKSDAHYAYSSINQSNDHYGVAIPGISNKYVLGTSRLVTPGVGVSDRFKVMYFDNQEQAVNALNYLNSKIIKFVIKTTKHNDVINMNKNVFNNIPLIDFNQAWSDEMLYNLFNLTTEEIAYVESTY